MAVDRTATKIKGFATGEMDFQLMRQLGACVTGGGAPGEVMAARAAINGENAAEWPGAFGTLADRLVAAAEEAQEKGHSRSAARHLMRASSYYRSAEYFSDPFDAAADLYGIQSRDTFHRGLYGLPCEAEPVAIPFEGKSLPAYLFTPHGAPRPNKAMLVLTGFDGTTEELWWQAAADGVAYGYTVLAAQGPGQMGTVREHASLLFRPDYEVPIGAMLDYAETRSEIDMDRIALYGISFGGYFAIRGALNDARVKALIANSPIIDLATYMTGYAEGVSDDKAAAGEDVTLDEVDEVPDEAMPAAVKLLFKAACRRYGVTSFSSWIAALQSYRADGLERIACPTLAMVGTGEGEGALHQCEVFSRSVSGPVTRRVFEPHEGADMHCQLGNLPLANAVIFDWLDEVFTR